MTETTVVHLMRHGQVHNPAGVLYGRLPGFVLSSLGRDMATRAAEFFADRDIVKVIASPLERAQETAAPIAAAHGLTVEVDERLIEAANKFEGRVMTGPRQIIHPRNWWLLRNPLSPSWGEPYRDQVGRMLAAVASARDAARGHEVVCVSHQLPIWSVRSHLTDRRLAHDPRRRECTLASVTSITYDGDDVVSVDYAEPARDLLPPTKKSAAVRGASHA